MTRLPEHSLHSFDLAMEGDWNYLTGVDEAGRGALAGPVVAGAVLLERDFYDSRECRELLSFVNDSKQLTACAREAAFKQMGALEAKGGIHWATGIASVEEIASLNILGATRLAMQRAIERVTSRNSFNGGFEFWTEAEELFARRGGGKKVIRLLIDGLPLKKFPYLHTAVVKGDGKSLAIGMASILAKIKRDQLMEKLHDEYPAFGLVTHKGYGTQNHFQALCRHGPSPIHRRAFLRKFQSLENKIPVS